ncbi:MAG: hypothetical protein JSW71_12750 [Gemmatimonadota bacterium]|nr:MAG: hypothetical protein JSW71_12750 [Gemmatimonadota bacterium]
MKPTHGLLCRAVRVSLIACLGCAGCSTAPSPAEISQAVLFHISYENYAWGHQSSGWYVDDQGRVWRLSAALHWWPEVRNILQGSEDTLYYSAGELEQSYADARDTLVAAIDADELREKYLLIAGAARGNYSTPANAAADAGSSVIGCLAYDQEADGYRKVILSMTGDWQAVNLANSATELDAWLRSLARRFIPGLNGQHVEGSPNRTL